MPQILLVARDGPRSISLPHKFDDFLDVYLAGAFAFALIYPKNPGSGRC